MKSFLFRMRVLPAAILAVSVLGCEQVEQVRDARRNLTPHEAYLASLSRAGLAETALVRDWISAGLAAVENAPSVQLPFQEEGFIAADEAGATAYRIHVGRGQRLTGELSLTSPQGTRVFLDLFRVPEDPGDPLRPVLSVDTVPGEFRYEPWRGGDFILRVQPELLRGGSYRVVLRLEAQLAFPVEGKDTRAILSGWGADRDAGRRTHQGVDIFAPRGTPVLATSDGVVNRVNVTPLGGKVVWLRDASRNANIYFAHLDSQAVRSGQRVRLGDVLGFVGNTGNARATSPHLHFGIYRRGEGAVDPAPFLRTPAGTLSELRADLGRLGTWVRMREEGIRLREAPGLRAEVRRELGRHTPLWVLAGSGDWYRVRLPDGVEGYVAARLTEDLAAPVETRIASREERVQAMPEAASSVITSVPAGAELAVLGRFGGYLLVQAPSGRPGWVDSDASFLP
ncbi:MAG TPA: M23 family metallopeptidase [Longimicrobiales bacterium]|nr:M23 family metallopeptidase [Longimicrobiales bacterium]